MGNEHPARYRPPRFFLHRIWSTHRPLSFYQCLSVLRTVQPIFIVARLGPSSSFQSSSAASSLVFIYQSRRRALHTSTSSLHPPTPRTAVLWAGSFLAPAFLSCDTHPYHTYTIPYPSPAPPCAKLLDISPSSLLQIPVGIPSIDAPDHTTKPCEPFQIPRSSPLRR